MRFAVKVGKKEWREMIRDKRVRSGAFVMPLFLVFLFMTLFGFMISAVSDQKAQRVHIVRTDNPVKLILEKAFDVKEVESVEQGVQLIKDGKARLILEVMPNSNQDHAIVTGHYDPKEQGSQVAFQMVAAVFKKLDDVKLQAYLKERQIEAKDVTAVTLNEAPVVIGEAKSANELIVSLLPYLLVLFAFTGGLAVASDLVAGEKEKNTLETLLISPITRTDIVLGKTGALALICFLSGLSGLLGFVICSFLKIKGTESIFKDGLGVSPAGIAAIVFMMIPLVIFFASVLVAVSTYAKNSREAQTYLGLVNLVVILPAVFSQVIGLTDLAKQQWINTIPILNVATNIRAILLGKPDVTAVAITFAVMLLIAGLAGWVAVRLFQREQVLTRV